MQQSAQFTALCVSLYRNVKEERNQADREVSKTILGRENSKYKGPEVRTTG